MRQLAPCLALTFCGLALGLAPLAAADKPAKPPADPYADFDYSKALNDGKGWTQAITVDAPACRAEVKGDVPVQFTAPGMTHLKAKCWQQPTRKDPNPAGHDVVLADLVIGADGKGSFVFPAKSFPNGPITIRLYADDSASHQRDLYQLQLFNQDGVPFKQGLPKTPPPAAAGMKLVFADEFDKEPSISADGSKATYCAHKPPNGDFSAWPFVTPTPANNPFSHVGTWLRIHAEQKDDGSTSTGLIASARMDGTGTFATAPYYFECRFLAQSAPGTWPAFWLLNQGTIKKGTNCDELDVIEAYGGLGSGTPNNDHYTITTHFWNQTGPEGKPDAAKDIRTQDMPGKAAYWSDTFHTYAVKVTADDTIYYCDDNEVFRHKSGTISSTDAYFFLINYAIGGPWPVDLKRYGNASDMWVDYVRVYQGEGPATSHDVAPAKP